ncbi:MAG: hypothetical protein ACJ8DI_35020, partial [Ktedonobacteraceae bacterium]
MLETAMEDSDLANRYFLNLVTGEVVFFSDLLGLSEEDERLSEELGRTIGTIKLPHQKGTIALPQPKGYGYS